MAVPRKPKIEKQTITVVVNGSPITVILHPPTGTRKSWYAYWPGLVASKATGQRDLNDAMVVAENMARNGGKRNQAKDILLSDQEFKALQRAHYDRKKDPDAQRRAAKSLKDCLEAIDAFKVLSGLDNIASATPADCGRFQQEALTLPRNWRHPHAKVKKDLGTVSPNTVLKWSRQLMAAFERCNRNAGRKCVRGVVDEHKLQETNPWARFEWLVEATVPSVRQFDPEELLSLLGFFETTWGSVPVGKAAAKVFLWSACRREEVAGLAWDAVREVDGEFHFEVVGKRNVKKWFRVPPSLYYELAGMRTHSTFVFSAYTGQLQQFHAQNPNWLQHVRAEFAPGNFGQWFYNRVKEWAATNPKGDAYVHIFRKTGLQHAREGEDINREVAADARVGQYVLTTHYITQTEAQLRAGSNRTYRRILASLPAEVACRYGHDQTATTGLEERIQAAVEAKNWDLVREFSARLAREGTSAAG
jgi:integrase